MNKRRAASGLFTLACTVSLMAQERPSTQSATPAQSTTPAATPQAGGGGRGGLRRQRTPGGPISRIPDVPEMGVQRGKPDFGGKGIWYPPYVIDMADPRYGVDAKVDVPFLPETKKQFDEATATHSKDDPEGFCLPPGVPRMMFTPYPFEILQLPNRVVFIYEGGAHVWRTVWMDGRQHPKDPNPTYLGDSIGHWEGDTLVVDSIGFNDRTWLDAAGHRHTEQLHVIEKYTRVDSNNLHFEATIDDPGAYSKPWTISMNIPWRPNQELMEYICQENNRDLQHLVGK